MKRAISTLLILVLLLCCLPLAQAADKPVTILLGSDFQNNCYDPKYDRYLYDNTPLAEQPRSITLKALLSSVAADGVTPDGALFAGDYTDHFQSDGDGTHCASEGIGYIRTLLDDSFGDGYTSSHTTLFAQGNHDYEGTPALAESGLQPYDKDDAYLVYVINEKDFPYKQTASVEGTISATAQRLGTCMDELIAANELRPILVLCHVPLHYSTRYNGGDNPYASLIFSELNEAAEELNVLFLFGHNHSGASADYEADWGGAVNFVARGQTLDVNTPNHGAADSNRQTLNFTYMNAGYVGYSTSATNDTRTVSLLSIYDNRVVISRYDTKGEYTAAESIGQTDPKNPSEGEVTSYPLTVPLLTRSEYTVSAVSAAPLYGKVEEKNGYVLAVPSENYTVSGWTLMPANAAVVTQDGNKIFFSDQTADCTLTVQFTESRCVSLQYKDLDRSQWYHDGVDYAISHGMFKGIAENRFDPEGTMTRAMLVTVLYRLEGSPAILPTTNFSDVPASEWYSSAVAWGKLRGIIDGVGGGRFAPEDDVTREQAATILLRYTSYKGYSISAFADLSAFRDYGSISNYAQGAMSWAVAAGLISGVGHQRLDPQGNATRAQLAVILMRYCVNIVES